MSNTKMTTILKQYQQTSPNSKSRRSYFDAFEKKMIYRTTKTENPRTTMKTVNEVLKKIATKI